MQAVPDFQTQFIPENAYESRKVRKQSKSYMLQQGFCSHCLKSINPHLWVINKTVFNNNYGNIHAFIQPR